MGKATRRNWSGASGEMPAQQQLDDKPVT